MNFHLPKISLVAALIFAVSNAGSAASVTGTINWALPTGIVASNLNYGLNAYQGFNPDVSGTPGNSTYKASMNYMQAGLIRHQRADEVDNATTDDSGWVLNPTNSDYAWDAAKISNALTGSFSYGPARIMCIVGWPAYLDDGAGHLQTNDYGAFAGFCSNLVRIINVNMKFHIEYWEVPNEKNGVYWGNNAELAKIYNQAAMAMKAVDSTIKVGGPAFNNLSQTRTVDMTDFLANAYSNLDFVSYHEYPSLNTNDSNALIWNDAANLGSYTTSIKSLIAEFTSRAIPTFFDEYNIDWQYATPSVTDLRMTNIDGAIFDALAMVSIVNAGTTGAAAWCDANTVSGKMNLNYHLFPGGYLYYLFNTYMAGNVVTSSSSDNSDVVIFALNDGTTNKFALVNRSGAAQTVQLSFSGWGGSIVSSNLFATEQLSSSGISSGTVSYGTLTGSAGFSLPVDTVTILLINEAALAPLPPAGLTAVSGDTRVALSWNPANDATMYGVNRSTNSGGPFSSAGETASTNFTDTNVVNGTVYYYAAMALNGNGASADSSPPVSALPWTTWAQALLANGMFQAYCSVTQNQTCVLEASTNLLSGWFPLITNTAATNGNLILINEPITLLPRQFFRIKYNN